MLLLYWTVDEQDDGEISRRKDVYGRDARMLEALNGKPRFVAPDNPPQWFEPGS